MNFLQSLARVGRSFLIGNKFEVARTLPAIKQILATPNYSPILSISRGFKDRDVLTKRCKDCYYYKDDERWYVLCRTHGRHKQRQRMPDKRSFWIVTHRTHGPRKKF